MEVTGEEGTAWTESSRPGGLHTKQNPELRATLHLLLVFPSSFPFAAAAAAKSLQSCPIVRPHRRQLTRLLRPRDSPGKNTGVGCHFLFQCVKVKSLSRVPVQVLNSKRTCSKCPEINLSTVSPEELPRLTSGTVTMLILLKNLLFGDFPGGPVVKNLPSNAGDPGAVPGWGTRIPYAMGQLSPCTTTTEPTCHNLRPKAAK